jgi:hypothetical protein
VAKAFTVKVLNIKQVLKKIEDLLEKDVISKELLSDISDFSVQRVQAETRKGNDLTGSSDIASAKKQPDLSQATKNFRRRLLKGTVRETHSWWFDPDPTFAKSDKSNLTATGQLLESLRGRITSSKGEVVVSPTGSRDSKRQNDNSIKTNVALAKDLASRGRTFLGLDKLGIKRIRKMILDEIRRFKKRRGF